jgi:hypothetical protein
LPPPSDFSSSEETVGENPHGECRDVGDTNDDPVKDITGEIDNEISSGFSDFVLANRSGTPKPPPALLTLRNPALFFPVPLVFSNLLIFLHPSSELDNVKLDVDGDLPKTFSFSSI